MADINEIYGSGGNFLKTTDIEKGKIMDCKVVSVAVKEIGDDRKLVIELEGGKAFVLNKTNAAQLANNLGTPDYEKWPGKTFKIFRTMTNYQGSTVECLRVV